MAAGLSRTVLQMKLEQKLNSQSDLTGAKIIAKTKLGHLTLLFIFLSIDVKSSVLIRGTQIFNETF